MNRALTVRPSIVASCYIGKTIKSYQKKYTKIEGDVLVELRNTICIKTKTKPVFASQLLLKL